MGALDIRRADAFRAQMVRVLNDSMTGLLVSVGQRIGLFDAMARTGDATGAAIARAAGADERYVRDWLGAMVTAAVVEYDGKRGTYQLPAEHARWLSADRLASMTRALSAFGAAADAVAAHRGSDPAASRAHAVHVEESAARLDACLIDLILPLAPGLPACLAAGIDVLDLGSGRAATLVAAAFPHSRVTAATGPAPPATDRDLALVLDGALEPAAAVTLALRALRPGGLLILADLAISSHLADNLDHPLAPALYATATLRSAAHWGEERAREAILAAGFTDLHVERVEPDPIHNYYVARAPG